MAPDLIYCKRGSTLLILIVMIFVISAKAQDQNAIKVDEVILSTSDRTYFSFGQGLGNYKTVYGIKRLSPLVFEGQVSPNFFLSLSKKRSIGIALVPKIVIRMYNETSVPVKTPSYMPSVLLYHSIRPLFPKRIFKSVMKEDQLTFMTYRLIHHSNGQNGSYFIPGSDSVNYINGNFSTNAFEIALSWASVDSNTAGKTYIHGRISYERQSNFEREPDIKNSYYNNKASIENRFIYSEKLKSYITYSFMWGTRKFGTRHAIDIFCAFKPFRKLTNFSVFIRGYVGPDYYNLYYVNTLRSLTFGIIADPLSIPVFKKRK